MISCNTKMKKFLISFLVVIMITSIIKPKEVSAETIEKRMWYEEWIALDEAKGHEEEIKEKVIDNLISGGHLGVTNEQLVDKDELEYILSIPKTILVGGKLKSTLFGWSFSFEITSFSVIENKKDETAGDENALVKDTFTYQELLNWTGKTEKELDEKILPMIQLRYNLGTNSYFETGETSESVATDILEKNRGTIEIEISGTKKQFTVTDVNIPGKDEQALKNEAFGNPTTSGTGGTTSGGTGGTGGTTSGGTGGTGGGSVGLPNLSDFKPTVSAGSAVSIIGSLLSVLMILGATMIVVAIAIIGFNTILGSASEKAEYQQKLVGVIFAGIFMVASSSIAKLIISVAVSF